MPGLGYRELVISILKSRHVKYTIDIIHIGYNCCSKKSGVFRTKCIWVNSEKRMVPFRATVPGDGRPVQGLGSWWSSGHAVTANTRSINRAVHVTALCPLFRHYTWHIEVPSTMASGANHMNHTKPLRSHSLRKHLASQSSTANQVILTNRTKWSPLKLI